ncbi:ubiquitin carboxyl-terminal hydrolase 12-like protein isoform X2 [Tanacetum coccineum]
MSKSENKGIVVTEMELELEQTQQGSSHEVSNIRVIPKYHSKDGNPARANIKQALGSYKDGDGVIVFRPRQVYYRMLILDLHIQRNHESSSICFLCFRNSDITRLLKWPSIKVKELQEQCIQVFKIKKGVNLESGEAVVFGEDEDEEEEEPPSPFLPDPYWEVAMYVWCWYHITLVAVHFRLGDPNGKLQKNTDPNFVADVSRRDCVSKDVLLIVYIRRASSGGDNGPNASGISKMNIEKAMEWFLKGVALGSSLANVVGGIEVETTVDRGGEVVGRGWRADDGCEETWFADEEQEDEEMLVPHTEPVEGPLALDGTPPVEGPQPMEVVSQGEVVSTAENQPTDEAPTRFMWKIENFSRQNTKKLYSDVFVAGGFKWRVLIFPKGNNVEHLSMYLDVADSTSLPYGWSRYAHFSLAVVNQMHQKFTVRKDTQHQFHGRENDWGFTSFMPLSDLYDPSKGYLVNDTCYIEADVAVRKVIDYWSYDSKKETGYVGLKNQGATCYMNSLLQTLYHIPYFRKAVYHMPTTENDMPSGSIPLALQSLFYKLQYNETSVATKELTKSFGWDSYESFMQHDVQELNRVLCEKLEDKMKGTVVEGTIQKLFEGHHMNYIECINVDFKSTRKESFYDLQLDVKGCRDVYASFDKYVEVERLEGDNKYHATEHGLQDAKKGVLFIDFPPVLQLQLKRFEYDFARDTMVKINDRYEFPLELDLDREDGKYLSPDADKSVRNLYTLHSVLVHSGGVHGGHYYAYIRPTLSDQWFKFDDERVTKEDMKRALEEQYGGEEELTQTNPGYNNAPFKFTKYSNAYMLVYIRQSDKEKIVCDVDEKDIAEHLRTRLKKEQEEKEDKRKYKAQAHLFTIIKVARDADLLEQIGKDTHFDLVDHDKVHSFRIQKQMPFNLFKEEVAKEFGVPVQYQRFWLWAKRQNHTYRPNRPLTPQEETQSVAAVAKDVSGSDGDGFCQLLTIKFDGGMFYGKIHMKSVGKEQFQIRMHDGSCTSSLYQLLQGETITSLLLFRAYRKSNSDLTKLWHMRLGHMSEKGMVILSKRGLLDNHKVANLEFCEHCVMGKQKRVSFSKAIHQTKGTSRLFLVIVRGPSRRVPSSFSGGARKISSVLYDNGLEFVEENLTAFCRDEGIVRHYTVRYTPQQNGVAERMNRTLLERTRCLLLNAGLDRSFWAEALNTTCYLVKRTHLFRLKPDSVESKFEEGASEKVEHVAKQVEYVEHEVPEDRGPRCYLH